MAEICIKSENEKSFLPLKGLSINQKTYRERIERLFLNRTKIMSRA